MFGINNFMQSEAKVPLSNLPEEKTMKGAIRA